MCDNHQHTPAGIPDVDRKTKYAPTPQKSQLRVSQGKQRQKKKQKGVEEMMTRPPPLVHLGVKIEGKPELACDSQWNAAANNAAQLKFTSDSLAGASFPASQCSRTWILYQMEQQSHTGSSVGSLLPRRYTPPSEGVCMYGAAAGYLFGHRSDLAKPWWCCWWMKLLPSNGELAHLVSVSVRQHASASTSAMCTAFRALG